MMAQILTVICVVADDGSSNRDAAGCVAAVVRFALISDMHVCVMLDVVAVLFQPDCAVLVACEFMYCTSWTDSAGIYMTSNICISLLACAGCHSGIAASLYCHSVCAIILALQSLPIMKYCSRCRV
jgi:hypothetical protein